MISTAFGAFLGVTIRVWTNALAKERYLARKLTEKLFPCLISTDNNSNKN